MLDFYIYDVEEFVENCSKNKKVFMIEIELDWDGVLTTSTLRQFLENKNHSSNIDGVDR